MCCRVLGGVYCSVIDRHSISIHHPPPACLLLLFLPFFSNYFHKPGYWWWLGSREWWKKREKGERRADETYYSSNSSISTRFLFRLIVERRRRRRHRSSSHFISLPRTNKQEGGRGKYAIVVRAVNKRVVIVGWLWKSGIETFFDGRDRPEVGTAITADDGLQWQ